MIAFLAKFAGLGGIPDKLVGIVKKIRQPIDKGLDKIVDWLGKMLQKLVGAAKEGAKKLFEWWRKKVPITGGDEPHTLTFQGERKSAKLVVRSAPEPPSEFLIREHQRKKQEPKTLTTPLKSTKASEKRDLRPPDRSWPRSTTTNARPHPARKRKEADADCQAS